MRQRHCRGREAASEPVGASRGARDELGAERRAVVRDVGVHDDADHHRDDRARERERDQRIAVAGVEPQQHGHQGRADQLAEVARVARPVRHRPREDRTRRTGGHTTEPADRPGPHRRRRCVPRAHQGTAERRAPHQPEHPSVTTAIRSFAAAAGQIARRSGCRHRPRRAERRPPQHRNRRGECVGVDGEPRRDAGDDRPGEDQRDEDDDARDLAEAAAAAEARRERRDGARGHDRRQHGERRAHQPRDDRGGPVHPGRDRRERRGGRDDPRDAAAPPRASARPSSAAATSGTPRAEWDPAWCRRRTPPGERAPSPV